MAAIRTALSAALWLSVASCASELAAARAAADAFPLAGTWHVLIHHQDASSARPEVWRWDERVWDFQPDGDAVLWTEYELVNFVNVTGRFAGLRTGYARRLEGAWEPDEAQLREIERGLFVNPRGALSLRLTATQSGWSSKREDGAGERASLGVRLSSVAAFYERDGRTVFALTREVRSPVSAERTQSTEYVFDAGSLGEGRYASGPRVGRFRLRPTALRERVRPALGQKAGRLLLIPDSKAQWENFLPMLARPWRYLPQRELRVESVPPGALLDVSYLRDGARRLFEETRAPLTLALPSRFQARRSDAVEVQAFAAGYQPAVRTLPVHGDDELLVVELEPAANELLELWTGSLFGAVTLRLRTRLPIALQTGRAPGAIHLVLSGTALAEPAARAAEGFGGASVESLSLLPLGADLLLRLSVTGDPELLFYASAGAIPDENWTTVRVGTAASSWKEELEAAARRVRADELAGCALAFDASLRSELGDEPLRALSLREEKLEALLRRAIAKLAEADPRSRVTLTDGSSYAPGRPLEMEVALSRAADVRGVHAALRAMLKALAEPAGPALRGLLAPGSSPAEFSAHLRTAEQLEASCRSAATAAGSARAP